MIINSNGYIEDTNTVTLDDKIQLQYDLKTMCVISPWSEDQAAMLEDWLNININNKGAISDKMERLFKLKDLELLTETEIINCFDPERKVLYNKFKEALR